MTAPSSESKQPQEAERMELLTWAQNHGVSELAVPRRVLHVPSIPLLATGKTDYVSVGKMALAEN